MGSFISARDVSLVFKSKDREPVTAGIEGEDVAA